jgi:hypothetical protein
MDPVHATNPTSTPAYPTQTRSLIQIKPNYKRTQSVDQLATEGVPHPRTEEIFRVGAECRLQLFQHQQEALSKARHGQSYLHPGRHRQHHSPGAGGLRHDKQLAFSVNAFLPDGGSGATLLP